MSVTPWRRKIVPSEILENMFPYCLINQPCLFSSVIQLTYSWLDLLQNEAEYPVPVLLSISSQWTLQKLTSQLESMFYRNMQTGKSKHVHGRLLFPNDLDNSNNNLNNLDNSRQVNTLRKTTTLLSLQNMFRQKLLSSSFSYCTKRYKLNL